MLRVEMNCGSYRHSMDCCRDRFIASSSAIDALVEVGIRSTRSDAASWLIHAGVEANASILESVFETVTEIRQLRTKAQTIAQQITKGESS